MSEIPNPKKKVDESWKEQIEAERAGAQPEKSTENPNAGTDAAGQAEEPKKVSFPMFLSTLGMQALIALGELENPADGKKSTQLPQAEYMIDLIGLIQEKTRGNLTDQENSMIQELLYELRMRFVEKRGKA